MVLPWRTIIHCLWTKNLKCLFLRSNILSLWFYKLLMNDGYWCSALSGNQRSWVFRTGLDNCPLSTAKFLQIPWIHSRRNVQTPSNHPLTNNDFNYLLVHLLTKWTSFTHVYWTNTWVFKDSVFVPYNDHLLHPYTFLELLSHTNFLVSNHPIWDMKPLCPGSLQPFVCTSYNTNTSHSCYP